MKKSKTLSLSCLALVLLCSTVSSAQEVPWKNEVRQDLYILNSQELAQANYDPVKIKALNDQAFNELSSKVENTEGVRVGHITFEQAQKVLDLTRKHSVVGLDFVSKYDPNGNIGFCFGRATFIHLELLRRGVQKEAIYKAFVVGEMVSGSITWAFHVTTIVRGENGEWFAIDPIFPDVMTLRDWFDSMATMDHRNLLRLYISHPSRLGPNSWEYNKFLFGPFYNNYFKELFDTFKNPPLESYKRPRTEVKPQSPGRSTSPQVVPLRPESNA